MQDVLLKHTTRALWFLLGVAVGGTALTIATASVPKNVTDDTVLYQKLSEIDVQKEKDLKLQRYNDRYVERLSRVESRYAERLPRARGAMARISKKPYRPAVKQKSRLAKKKKRRSKKQRLARR